MLRRLKVLGRDREAGLVKLRADTLDDLWHLRELVEEGDVVTALTWRTADIGRKEDDRGGKAEKRAMTLGVRVESVEFHPFSNWLRLLGPIVEGPQDLGSYHTIAVEPGTELTVRKLRGLRRHHEERIEEAVAATTRPLVTILSLEDNEAVVAALRQYGVQKMAEIFGHVSGKQYGSAKGAENDFFDEILMALRDYRPENAPLLVVGPGFAKERFLAYAKTKEPAAIKGAALEATGQAGMAGVHEALKRGSIERVTKESRVARETLLVEKLMTALGEGRPATYGMQEVTRACELGAADIVLVIDKLVREGPGETLLDLARSTGAQARVVSTHHEAGQRLAALGGVAALLRYAVP